MKNESAFPHIDSGCGRFEEGMTLRDYFAAKAMQSELMDREWQDIKSLSLYAYDIADAMLKARDGNS
jgi:hypothetical protein